MASQRMTEDQANLGTESKPAPSKFNQGRKQPAQAKATQGNASGIASKKASWKQQSEVFRSNLKQARGVTLAKEEQVNLAKGQHEGLVQCEHCARKFNEAAAQRHIPYCKNKQKMDNLKKPAGRGKPMKK